MTIPNTKPQTVYGPRGDRPNLDEVLAADGPPLADQVITYVIDDCGTVHSGCCSWQQDHDKFVQTTGKDLNESLKNHKAKRGCEWWYTGRGWYVDLLLSRMKNPTNDSGVGADVRLAMYHEAEKPGNVDAWCQWSSGASAKQLREKGRQELAWNSTQHEAQVVCFDVDVMSKTSWIIGIGVHALPVGVDGGIVVHGMLPERIAVQHQLDEEAYVVPVGPGFNETMFNVAVNLYETWVDVKNAQETALRAVQTAEMALRQQT